MKPRSDLGMGLGVILMCKLAKSIIKTSSKVHKPKTYNEVINNPIHGNRWYKAIHKNLENLNFYQV